jgi:hypothetical protein
MRTHTVFALPALAVLLAACSSASSQSSPSPDASPVDAATDGGHDAASSDGEALDSGVASSEAGDSASNIDSDAQPDAGNGCSYEGAPGECIATQACAAMADHTSFPNLCPGPANIECCIVTPSTADNPPAPAGWVLMMQSEVTAAMTSWAVMILDDPSMYPMFSTTTMTFGSLLVLARVEWHPPDSNNESIHRGVTLYQQTD